MATTQLAYATAERDAARDMLTEATRALGLVQVERFAAQQLSSDVAMALRDVQTAITLTREQLAIAPVCASTALLIAALEKQTADQHALTGRAAHLAAAGREVTARERFWAARVALLTPQLARAETTLLAATEESARRAARVVLAGDAALAASITLAGNILSNTGTTLFSDAEKKLKGPGAHVPAEMFDSALQRFDFLWGRVALARTAVGTAADALTTLATTAQNLQGKERDAWNDFVAADARVTEVVSSTVDRLSRAQTILRNLSGLTAQAITDAEADEAAAGLVSGGPVSTALLTRVGDVFAAQQALDVAEAAYRLAFTSARAADPTLTDTEVNTDAVVAPLKTTRDGKASTLGTARTALTMSDLDKLRTWYLSLSDQSWRRLHEFFEAKALLTELAAATPGTWATALGTAEGVWGDAATALSASRRSLELLEANVALAVEHAQAAADSVDSLSFAAVRGDTLFER